MARLDARALALVVLLACGKGGQGAPSTAEPRAGSRGTASAALTLAPAADITGSLFQAAGPGWLWAPNVAGSGDLHLVVWSVSDGAQTDLRGARVTTNGDILDPGGFVISSAPGDQKGTAVAGGGYIPGGSDGWMVAWVDQRSGLFPPGTTSSQGDIYVARVAVDGTVIDPGGLPVATGGIPRTDPAVSAAGAGWLVTWREGNAFAGATFYAGGDVNQPYPFPIGTSTGVVGFSDLSCAATTCLLVWTRFDPATGQRDLEGVRVDAGITTAIDASPFPVAAGAGRQDGPRVAFDGLDWLVVFEHSLATADYQVMATRVSQAGGVLDPAWIPVSTAYSTVPGRPGVAFDGRNFVVAWRDSRDGSADLDLWVRTVAPDGALLGSEQLVFDGVPGTRLARIGSAGWNRALVAFTEDVDGTAALHGRIVIDQDERPSLGLQAVLGPVAQVDSPTSGGSLQRGAFAVSPGGVLAVWQQPTTTVPPYSSDLYAARVDEAGNVLDPGGFVLSAAPGRQAFQAAEWAGTHWVVLWEDYRTSYLGDLYAARVAADGTVLDPEGVFVAGGDGVLRRAPDLAFDETGNRLVAVWLDASAAVSAAVLDPATLQLLVPPFVVGSFPPGSAWRFPRVSCGGGSCLAAWSHTGDGDGDVYGARIDPAGLLLDAAPIPICLLPGNQQSGSIAWDGLGWMVVWHDGRSLAGYDVYATRVGPDGAVQDADGFAVAEPRNVDSTATPITFDGERHLVTWLDELRGGQGFLTAMGPGGRPFAPDVQVTGVPGATVRAVRAGATRPGRAVIHYTASDPSTPTVAHVFVRSFALTPPTFPLTVSRGGSGAGSVTSSPAGIDCGAACAADFPAGSTVTLTARPAAGSVFSGWSGACSGTATTCTVAMTDARTVGAAFSLVSFPLTVRTSGTGRGTVTGDGISCTTGSTAGCSASFGGGAVVTLTAAPEAGSIFWSWIGCTSVAGNVCTVSMTAAKTVTATFQPATWLLTARTSGTGRGTVTGGGISCTTGSTVGCTAQVPNTVPATAVTLTAAPEAGSVFWSWSGCTSVSGNICTASMTAAKTVTATFQPATWLLTARTSGTGRGTVTGAGITCTTGSTAGCTVQVPNTSPATSVTLTATAETGSVFSSWLGCTSVSGNVCTVSMTAAKTVTATFSPATWLLTAKTSGTGRGTVTGGGIACTTGSTVGCTAQVPNTVPATPVTLTATAETGSVFSSWIGCTTVSGNVCTVSMTMAKTVTATFQPATWLLTARTSGTGRGTVTGGGIACTTGSTAGCTAEVPNTSPATPVTLTATPDPASVFSSWLGCTSVSGNVCTVSMTAAKTVTATFQPATWLLTARTSGSGRGTVTGGGISCTTGSTVGCTAQVPNTVPATPVTLTAAAETGSVFWSWSGCTSVAGNVCTVSMTAAKTVTATFQPATWLLTARTSGIGRGTVTGGGITCTTGSTAGCTAQVPNTSPATQVTLTATPEAGSTFSSWSGCTTVSGNVCTVSMTAARTVTATFADYTYPLTVTVTVLGSGAGTVTGPGISCTSGSTVGCSTRIPITTPPTDVTLVVTNAIEGFGGWTGCTAVSGTTCTVTMDAARAVTATINGMPYPL